MTELFLQDMDIWTVLADIQECDWLPSEESFFYSIHITAWALAALLAFLLICLRTPRINKSNLCKSGIHTWISGRWFEIAGIHNIVDRQLRSGFHADYTNSNLVLQFLDTGGDDLDTSWFAENNVEIGKSVQGFYGRSYVTSDANLVVAGTSLRGMLQFNFPLALLYVSPARDIVLLASPAKTEIYLLAKRPRLGAEEMMHTLKVIVSFGYSVKDLHPIKQIFNSSDSMMVPTVRRYGILSTAESRGTLEPGALFNPFPAPNMDVFTTANATSYSSDGTPPDGNTPVQAQSSTRLISPFIFRTPIDPDLASHTMEKFFDGCVRGDLRFVADFVDREFLWVEARNRGNLWCSLHYAAYNGYPELVEYLLEKFASPLARTVRQETPLMLAVVGLIRHVEERLAWDDGTSCAFDLQDGDTFYSFKPHSLERYDETVKLLLQHSAILSLHKNNMGLNPEEILLEAMRNLESELQAHPTVQPYIRKYLKRIYRKLYWSQNFIHEPIVLLTPLSQLCGVLVWAFFRVIVGTWKLIIKIIDALTFTVILLAVSVFYWYIFRFAGRALIKLRWWAPAEKRRLAAEEFDGDCALLIVLSLQSPIVTKLGQLLSGRIDLLPEAVALRLAVLQNQAPAMSPSEVEKVLRMSYGEDRSHLFESFEMHPFAVGTVAQVHRATLRNGNHVAVKVVKRGMNEGLDRLLFILDSLSRIGVFGKSKAGRSRVERISKLITHQTDMNLEAASMYAMQRRAQFHLARGQDPLHVAEFPRVHSLLTSQNVLVMDEMDGCVPFGTFARSPTIPRKIMFNRLGRIYLRNLYMDGIMHSDLHPGNIMVRPDDGRIVLLDFGLVGELTETDRAGLTAFTLAAITSESDLAMEIFIENFVQDADKEFADEERKDGFIAEMRPIFKKHLGEAGPWDMARFAAEFNTASLKYDISWTSGWAIVQMGILHFQSTVALLRLHSTFRDILWQLLYFDHAALLETLTETKYYALLEGPVRKKFAWGLMFKADNGSSLSASSGSSPSVASGSRNHSK